MKEDTMTSRRNVVARAALAVGGLFGLGVATATGRAVAVAPETMLVLRGRGWRTNAGRPGMLPSDGDRIGVRGDLIDDAKGEYVGEFIGAGFAIGGAAHPAQIERLELHTFKLREGTIIGSGTAGQLDGVFAILGGTGRYANARGTYVARQRHEDLGGDGSAEFVLRLIP
jgi:hypothetical protein